MRNMYCQTKSVHKFTVWSVDTNHTSISELPLFIVSQGKKISSTTYLWLSYSCSTYLSDNSADKQARYRYNVTDKIKWNHYNLWINHVNKEWLSKQIKVQ